MAIRTALYRAMCYIKTWTVHMHREHRAVPLASAALDILRLLQACRPAGPHSWQTCGLQVHLCGQENSGTRDMEISDRNRL
jgi:hypothetical protein